MVRHLEAALRPARRAARWLGTVRTRPGPRGEPRRTRAARRRRRPRPGGHGRRGRARPARRVRPAWLAIVVGSRLAPSINLCRLRVAGDLVEIGPDDLRFRAWEVERLFREHYGEPVPPEELAVLARRTEGWAAGLQLFHLATRGKPADERRRILAAVGAGAGSSAST